MTFTEILTGGIGWLCFLIIAYAVVHFIASRTQYNPQCYWCDGRGIDGDGLQCGCCEGTGDNPMVVAIRRKSSLRERGDI